MENKTEGTQCKKSNTRLKPGKFPTSLAVESSPELAEAETRRQKKKLDGGRCEQSLRRAWTVLWFPYKQNLGFHNIEWK